MTPEHKEDLVCPFHGDIEGYMARIEHKVDRIEVKIGAVMKDIMGLQLWRAKVIGYAAGVSAVVAIASKYVFK
jgi:hypothetical protein